MEQQERMQELLRGIMPGDVVDAWEELSLEWVRDLRMLLEPLRGQDGRSYLRFAVVSMRYDDEHPHGYEYCWAKRDFPHLGYSISPAQLFELLIEVRLKIARELNRE
jgi:hypothetical protein